MAHGHCEGRVRFVESLGRRQIVRNGAPHGHAESNNRATTTQSGVVVHRDQSPATGTAARRSPKGTVVAPV